MVPMVTRRHTGERAIAAGFGLYLGGFLVSWLFGDRDAPGALVQLWLLSLVAPVPGVAIALWLSPRWRLLVLAVSFLIAFPIALHGIGLVTRLESGETNCDPCIDSTFFSVIAVPALAAGAVGLAAGTWRDRRKRTTDDP
jgi:hypothetical protein